MLTLSLTRIQLVKESTHRYDAVKKISCPDDVARAVCTVFGLDTRAEEHFLVIALDTKNKINGIQEISMGTVNSSLVHPREVFKVAILHNATGIILVHNHPSGDATPSKEDIMLTARLTEAGKMMDIPILDHLIIGDGYYVSFKEEQETIGIEF